VSGSNRQAKIADSAACPAVPSDESKSILPAVLEAQTGDADGIRRFLTAIAPWVRRTCCGVLGSAHPDLDDTMQECLFASVKALRNYRFEGDIRHYVTKISLRISIAARGTNAARSRNQDLLKSQPPWELAAPIPEEWFPEEIDLVRRILDRLSGVQKEAVLMRVVLGFSLDEIATITGVSQNTVKTRVRLGKNALRKNLRKSPFWRRWLLERTP
jgi:RNA polymerase sigma factor (sigma-70 family)